MPSPLFLLYLVPFFASSALVGGLLLADVCAYVVRRYLDKRARPSSYEERQFLKLLGGAVAVE